MRHGFDGLSIMAQDVLKQDPLKRDFLFSRPPR
jgi:hypothetical protein